MSAHNSLSERNFRVFGFLALVFGLVGLFGFQSASMSPKTIKPLGESGPPAPLQGASPVVHQFYPIASPAGGVLIVTGSGFTSGAQVFFGGTRLIPSPNVSVVSPTLLQVEIPSSGTLAANINGYLTVMSGGNTITTQNLPASASNPGNPASTYPDFVLLGDASQDGLIGASDYSLARAFSLFQVTPTPTQVLACDLVPTNGNASFGDGNFTTTDVTLLRAITLSQVTFCSSNCPVPSRVQFSEASAYQIQEGNTGSTLVTITAERTGDTGKPASFTYQITDGTAGQASGDYSGATASPVPIEFAAGETTKPFTITINGDTAIESNETVTLILTPVFQSGTSYSNPCIAGPDRTKQTIQFTILTDDVCSPIALVPTNLGNGTQNSAYTAIQLSAVGGVGTYTYSVTGGALPNGMTLGSDGLLSGTPTTAGTATIAVTATDGRGCTGTQPYTLNIIAPQPTLTATPAGDWASGNFGDVAVGTQSSPRHYRLTGQNLSGSVTVGPAFSPSQNLTNVFQFSTSPGGPYTASLIVPAGGGVIDSDIWVVFAPTSAQTYNGTIPHGGGGVVNPPALSVGGTGTSAPCTGRPSLLADTETTLYEPEFGQQPINTQSQPRSYVLSGGAFTGQVKINPPEGFKVSLQQNSGFQGQLSIQMNCTLPPTTIWVRFEPTEAKPYSGQIVNTLEGLPQTAVVNASGTGTASIASLSVNTVGFVSDFGTQQVGTQSQPSLAHKYHLSGQHLTGPVTVAPTAPDLTNVFLVSRGETLPFTPSLTIEPSGGVVEADIWVVFKPLAGRVYDGSIVHSSPNAPTKFVSVKGTGGINCPTITVGTVNSVPVPNGTVGQPYPATTFTASGGAGSYGFSALGLDPGMTFSVTSPTTAVLAGTPQNEGDRTITITATDAVATSCAGSQSYTIHIGPAGGGCASTLTPATLNPAMVGQYFSTTFGVPPGTTGTYTYAMSTTPPPGLTFLNGVLNGTPATNSQGDYNFTVTANGPNGCVVSKPYTLTVLPAPSNCPTITVGSNPASLLDGIVGVAYLGATFSASPVGSYSFEVSPGSLPTGMFLTQAGTLTGTPTQSGTFPITVTARSTSDPTCSGNRLFPLIINPAPSGITIPPDQPADKEISPGTTATLVVSPSGSGPFRYEWFMGNKSPNDIPAPRAADSPTYTTPELTGTAQFWVRVKNATDGSIFAESRVAVVTVADTTIQQGPVLTSVDPPVASANPNMAKTTVWVDFIGSNLGGNTRVVVTPSEGIQATIVHEFSTRTKLTAKFEIDATAQAGIRQVKIVRNDRETLPREFRLNPPGSGPQLVTVSPSQSIRYGETATLQVEVAGVGPFTYQWYEGTTGYSEFPIIGSKGNKSILTTSQLAYTSYFWVRVRNAGGVIDVPAITVNVANPVPNATYGISSIMYDPASDYLEAVSSTQILDSIAAYYITKIIARVTDQNDRTLAGTQDVVITNPYGGFAAAIFSLNHPERAEEYRVKSDHCLLIPETLITITFPRQYIDTFGFSASETHGGPDIVYWPATSRILFPQQEFCLGLTTDSTPGEPDCQLEVSDMYEVVTIGQAGEHKTLYVGDTNKLMTLEGECFGTEKRNVSIKVVDLNNNPTGIPDPEVESVYESLIPPKSRLDAKFTIPSDLPFIGNSITVKAVVTVMSVEGPARSASIEFVVKRATVEVDDFSVVPKHGTIRVPIKPKGPAMIVKVTVKKKPNGGAGEAVIEEPHQFMVSSSTVIRIRGVEQSEHPDNMTLEVSDAANDRLIVSKDFTVSTVRLMEVGFLGENKINLWNDSEYHTDVFDPNDKDPNWQRDETSNNARFDKVAYDQSKRDIGIFATIYMFPVDPRRKFTAGGLPIQLRISKKRINKPQGSNFNTELVELGAAARTLTWNQGRPILPTWGPPHETTAVDVLNGINLSDFESVPGIKLGEYRFHWEMRFHDLEDWVPLNGNKENDPLTESGPHKIYWVAGNPQNHSLGEIRGPFRDTRQNVVFPGVYDRALERACGYVAKGSEDYRHDEKPVPLANLGDIAKRITIGVGNDLTFDDRKMNMGHPLNLTNDPESKPGADSVNHTDLMSGLLRSIGITADTWNFWSGSREISNNFYYMQSPRNDPKGEGGLRSATFRLLRPRYDQVEENPHLKYHAAVKIMGLSNYYDPAYGDNNAHNQYPSLTFDECIGDDGQFKVNVGLQQGLTLQTARPFDVFCEHGENANLIEQNPANGTVITVRSGEPIDFVVKMKNNGSFEWNHNFVFLKAISNAPSGYDWLPTLGASLQEDCLPNQTKEFRFAAIAPQIEGQSADYDLEWRMFDGHPGFGFFGQGTRKITVHVIK